MLRKFVRWLRIARVIVGVWGIVVTCLSALAFLVGASSANSGYLLEFYHLSGVNGGGSNSSNERPAYPGFPLGVKSHRHAWVINLSNKPILFGGAPAFEYCGNPSDISMSFRSAEQRSKASEGCELFSSKEPMQPWSVALAAPTTTGEFRAIRGVSDVKDFSELSRFIQIGLTVIIFHVPWILTFFAGLWVVVRVGLEEPGARTIKFESVLITLGAIFFGSVIAFFTLDFRLPDANTVKLDGLAGYYVLGVVLMGFVFLGFFPSLLVAGIVLAVMGREPKESSPVGSIAVGFLFVGGAGILLPMLNYWMGVAVVWIVSYLVGLTPYSDFAKVINLMFHVE